MLRLIIALGLLPVGLPPAARAQTADPPGTALFMGQYRAWFAAVDTNKDGYLDKEELAKAFRGPNAKPYDYVPPPKKDPKKDARDGKDEKTEEKKEDKKDEKKDDKTSEKKDDKSQEKPSDKSDKPDKPAKKPDYSRYPDYNFLVQLDTDSDEQISKAEFESWARDIAAQLKAQVDAQKRLLDLQNRLLKEGDKLKANDRKRIENDLRRERDQYHRVQDQIRRLERHFNEAQHRPSRR